MDPTTAIIPHPQKIEPRPGQFELGPNSRIACPPEGRQAARLLEKITRLPAGEAPAAIQLRFDPRIHGGEAYELTIHPAGIQISASAPAGLFYGAQTLRQLLPPEVEKTGLDRPVPLPCVHITDAPRFPYRGFMLDESRHFHGPGEVYRIIDLLALQKINRFHWHLTDDQGWRIQIQRYPRLIEVGAWRKESQVGGWLFGRPFFDGRPYGGYYTQEDIRQVVAYARENFIEIIPEIDAPGHSTAAIASYPELSCDGLPAEVQTRATGFGRPLCPGKETTYSFFENVYSEMIELFPYRHFHIGGDEVNQSAWKKCPDCRRRMDEEGLKNGHELEVYFANRLVKDLKSRGCTITGWNEILDDALDPDVINQYWFMRRQKTLQALRGGRRTIISELSSYYLDYSFQAISLEKTYTFDPQYPRISDVQAAAILGIEGPLWAEYVYSRERIDWQMFPRLLAVSESAWTPQQAKNYPGFLERLQAFEKRLDVLGVGYAPRACYLAPRSSLVPPILRMLSTEHPAMKEFKRYHPTRQEAA